MPLKRKLCHGSVGGKVKVHLREKTDADHDFRGLESPNTKPQARKVEMGILESQQHEDLSSLPQAAWNPVRDSKSA